MSPAPRPDTSRPAPPVRRQKRPREVNHVRLTLLVAMLFTILVATMFRTTAIVFMAAMLCAAPLAGMFAGRFLGRSISITRQIPEIGTSGDLIAGRVLVQNRGRLPAFLIHLWPGSVDDGAQSPLALTGEAEYIVPLLRADESVEWAPQWRLGRRGVYHLPPVEAGARDPLGLFTTTQPATEPDTITVLPRPVRVSRLGFCGGTSTGAHTPHTAAVTPDASDFHGIRTWRPGEAIRRVHWKSTVRTGELHVVEWEEDPGCDLTIVFDARSFAPQPQAAASTRRKARREEVPFCDEALETQITLAASIALHLLENGRIFRFFCWQDAPGDAPKTAVDDKAEPQVLRHQAQRTAEVPGTMKMLAQLQTVAASQSNLPQSSQAQSSQERLQPCSLTRLAGEVLPQISRGSGNMGGIVIIGSTLSDYAEASALLGGTATRRNAPFVLAVDPTGFQPPPHGSTRPHEYSKPGSAPAVQTSVISAAALDVRVVRRGDSLVVALER